MMGGLPGDVASDAGSPRSTAGPGSGGTMVADLQVSQWINSRPPSAPRSEVGRIVLLNVGGKQFATSIHTLQQDEDTMLYLLVEGRLPSATDASGAYFIDRDPTHFHAILNFLRDGDVDLPEDAVSLAAIEREATFYQIGGLIRRVQARRRRLALPKPLSRESLLQLLHRSAPSTRLQLSCTRLTGLVLSHLCFTGGDRFVEADFSRCEMIGTVLREAEAARASFRAANMTAVDLSSADCSGADFTGAIMKKARLVACDLTGATLLNADLTRANLQHAKFKQTRFDGSRVQKAYFVGCDLRGQELTSMDAREANFEGARLEGANLSGSNLSKANLYGARLDGCSLHGCDLTGANLDSASMNGVTGSYRR